MVINLMSVAGSIASLAGMAWAVLDSRKSARTNAALHARLDGVLAIACEDSHGSHARTGNQS